MQYHNHGAISGTIFSIIETDQGLLVGGSFNGEIIDDQGIAHEISNLAHVTLTGEFLDLELGPGTSGAIRTVTKDQSGRILLGGSFTGVHGHRVTNVARLNTDRTVDTTFKTTSRPDSAINDIKTLNDGRILIASLSKDLTGADFAACVSIQQGACSIPFKIVALDPDSMTIVDTLYATDGEPMGAGTVGLRVGDELFIGTFHGDRILRVK